MRTLYHSDNCPGHVLAPGEPLPPLSQCRQYPDTVDDAARRDPLLGALWWEVVDADRERK